jgi:hypothetical protein
LVCAIRPISIWLFSGVNYQGRTTAASPSGQDHQVKFKSLERSPSLPQEIVASLTGALFAGELRPGDRLPSEQALATEFGVARTVVREAISQLKYDGIVQSRVGVGTTVAVDLPLGTEPAAPVGDAAAEVTA